MEKWVLLMQLLGPSVSAPLTLSCMMLDLRDSYTCYLCCKMTAWFQICLFSSISVVSFLYITESLWLKFWEKFPQVSSLPTWFVDHNCSSEHALLRHVSAEAQVTKVSLFFFVRFSLTQIFL
jgi:hypothetical protein